MLNKGHWLRKTRQQFCWRDVRWPGDSLVGTFPLIIAVSVSHWENELTQPVGPVGV